MMISIVAAVSENNVIGFKNTLPWRLPADFQRMKEITMGKPLIMGRKTHQSIGRVLPGRRNIVITSDPSRALPGAEAVSSLEEALALVRDAEVPEAIIFGGADIYRQAMLLADRIYLTSVHATIEGDAFFPEISRAEWTEVSREDHSADAEHSHAFSFVLYQRKG